jgi:hypothetical protein
MNETSHDPGDVPASREEMLSAVFAGFVIQQAQMALMLMGRIPHPESGERVHDVEGAQLFIDQLEMLAAKTKGNLDKREEQLLQQNLTALRLAFVETVEAPPGQASNQPKSEAGPSSQAASTAPVTPSTSEADEAEAESRKKFTKKY